MAKAMAMLVFVALVVATMSAGGASAQDCNPVQLTPCLISIVSGVPPSPACCTNLSAQQGCLCQYAQNPAYANYVNSPNARHTLTSCGLTIPSCK